MKNFILSSLFLLLLSQHPISQPKILYSGTSIPEKYGSQSYPMQVGRMLGITVDNQSVGESQMIWDGTYAKSLSATRAELRAKGWDEKQSYEYKLIGKKETWFILDHGYNDKAKKLGTLTSLDRSTFYGAWNYVIKAVLADNPKVRIILVIPPNNARWGVHPELVPQLNGMHDAIVALGSKYGFPVIDLMRNIGYNDYTYNTLTVDGTHPTQECANQIAVYIANFIRMFIEGLPTSFLCGNALSAAA